MTSKLYPNPLLKQNSLFEDLAALFELCGPWPLPAPDPIHEDLTALFDWHNEAAARGDWQEASAALQCLEGSGIFYDSRKRNRESLPASQAPASIQAQGVNDDQS